MNITVPSGITIRKAPTKDFAHDLYQLQEFCLPLDTPADVSNGHWWIASDDDDPVGFGGFYRSVQWDDAVYLCRAGVVPSHRGRGLQKRLIRVRVAAARRQGYRWAVTETAANPASANSLIACGFRISSRPNPGVWQTPSIFGFASKTPRRSSPPACEDCPAAERWRGLFHACRLTMKGAGGHLAALHPS